MAELKTLEVKIQPKFVIDEDVAHQCLTLLEMYCNSHNKVVKSFFSKKEDAENWSITLDFDEPEDES